MSEKPEILLIDDEPLILESLRLLFKRDYTVHTAENGERGLALIKMHAGIKVVISDQRMPGLMGHETLREIKKIRPQTVRVLLTGYSDLEAILQSVNSGEVFRYINKPWDSERLAQVVQLGFQINKRLENLELEAIKVKDQSALPNAVIKSPVLTKKSILFVDSNDGEVQRLVNQFSTEFECTGVSSPDSALKELATRPIAVVVSNVDFPNTDAIDFLSAISHEYPNTVTVIYTQQRDANLAIRAINELSVFRYLVNPTDNENLPLVIDAAFATSKARENKLQGNYLHIVREDVSEKSEVSELRRKVESSPYLQKLRALRKAS